MNRTTFSIFITKFIALFLLGIISFPLAGCAKEHSHQSDDKMISQLQKDKSEYDRLIELLQEDKNLDYIAKYDVPGENDQYHFLGKALSDERRNQYLAILNKIQPEVVSIFRKAGSDELREVEISVSVSEYRYDFYKYKTTSKKSYVWMNPTICPENQINPRIRYVTLDQGEKQIFIAPCNFNHPDSLILSENLDKYHKYVQTDVGPYRKIGEHWYLHISAHSDEYHGE